MIIFTTNQSGYYNDMADVVRLFFGMEKVAQQADGEAEAVITHQFAEEGGQWVQHCHISSSRGALSKTMESSPVASADRLYVERMAKRLAKLCLYWLLREYTGMSLPWGSLTGIRPTKVARQLINEGCEKQAVASELERIFDVSPPKANLVSNILQAQQGIWRWGDTAFDVYIGIPFCRTRCLYCSFFSSDAAKPRLVDAYLAALHTEIAALGHTMAEHGRQCRTIYIGGGTPVAISTAQLQQVLMAAQAAFPNATELTVEAGRPDSVTPDTMAMLHDMGVSRVSINPQTMNDDTLQVIGRGHTASDVLRAYDWARQAGIAQINMDLIIGLPGEGIPHVERTLAALAPLGMDNLTVHTLAIKHSSRLNERLADYPLPTDEEATQMLDLAHAFATDRGMRPYYMYRQKYMRGNLENVGYALPGAECVYNIDMMEETHDIVALGAGAVSKRMFFEQNRHERFPNPKNIEYFVSKIEELIDKKVEFFSQKTI